MNRPRAVLVISKRRIFETFISPSCYIIMSLGLLLGYLMVAGFIKAVDSSGLNFMLNPVYEQLARFLSGAFGETYVLKLFSEGPFLFSLYLAFVPFLLYLTVSSVYKFGFERNVGALELIVYGPADATSSFMAFLIRNVFFTLLYLLALLLFFWVTSLINNLVLGPQFFHGFLFAFFLSLAVCCYGILAAVLAKNASVGVALFTGIIVFFILIEMGSFTIVSGYAKNLSSIFAAAVQWISPLFYWSRAFAAADYGNAAGTVISLLLMCVLSAFILLAGHFIIKMRGVRD